MTKAQDKAHDERVARASEAHEEKKHHEAEERRDAHREELTEAKKQASASLEQRVARLEAVLAAVSPEAAALLDKKN